MVHRGKLQLQRNTEKLDDASSRVNIEKGGVSANFSILTQDHDLECPNTKDMGRQQQRETEERVNRQSCLAA